MGSEKRALRISNNGTNKAMKAIILYTFKKCGNCVLRVQCLVEETLSSGGFKKPVNFILENLAWGCRNPKKYEGHGLVARNVAKIAHNECATCPEFDHCITKLLEVKEYTNEDKNELIRAQAHRCVKCDRLDDCVQQYCEEFKLKNYKIFLEVFLKKFKDCDKCKKQMVYIDIGNEDNSKFTVEEHYQKP